MSKKSWMKKKQIAKRDKLKLELWEYGDLYCASYAVTISGLPKPYRFNNTVWAPDEDNALDQIKNNVRALATNLRQQHGLYGKVPIDAKMEAGGLVREMCHCEEKEDGSWQAISIQGTRATGANELLARDALLYTVLDNMLSQGRVRKALEKALAEVKKGTENVTE